MLIALYGIMASLFNRDAKTLIKAVLLLIIAVGVYGFMLYKANTFVYGDCYYSVNSWAENLVIVITITEGIGVAVWVYTIRNIFKK